MFANDIVEKTDDTKEEINNTMSMESKQSTLSLSIDSSKKQSIINSKLIKKCNIGFYKTNTELLFSINPFTFNDKKWQKLI